MSKVKSLHSNQTPSARPVWVLDTNVVLDWLIFRDPHIQPLVRLIESAQVQLVSRADCRDELVRVLGYAALQADDAQQEQALQTYDRWHSCILEPIDDSRYQSLPLCRDADDQKFLELACDAKAQWLITKDEALLQLAPGVRRLGHRTGGFEIVDVLTAARLLSPGN